MAPLNVDTDLLDDRVAESRTRRPRITDGALADRRIRRRERSLLAGCVTSRSATHTGIFSSKVGSTAHLQSLRSRFTASPCAGKALAVLRQVCFARELVVVAAATRLTRRPDALGLEATAATRFALPG